MESWLSNSKASVFTTVLLQKMPFPSVQGQPLSDRVSGTVIQADTGPPQPPLGRHRRQCLYV